MEKINNNNYFYIKKIGFDEFIIYNSKKHIPVKVDRKGKAFFDIIRDHSSLKECLNKVNKSEKNEFIDFHSSLSSIDFFSTNDEFIDKNILQPTFEEIKKNIYLHLTDRCNFKCSYCYNSEYRNDPKDMPLKEWKIIIDKIVPFAENIIITGGEPLLHKNFKEILTYIKYKNNHIKISLFSNGGLNYKDLALKDVLDKIDIFNLSCDNLSNSNHERIGFNKNVFKANLKYLRENGYSKDIAIHSVWTKDRLNEIKEVRSFCENLGYKSVVSLLIPNNEKDMIKMPLVYKYENYLRERNMVNNTTDESKEDESIIYKTISCGAARYIFSIDAHGNCYPCQSFHFPEFLLGNLLEQSFKEIYYSPVASMLRVANDVDNKKVCKDCNLKYICSGGCIANTFDIEGGLLEYPETMCPYYKTGAINRLINVKF